MKKIEQKKPLPTGRKGKNVIGLMKDESGGEITIKFATTAPKTYRYRVQKHDHKIEKSEFIKVKRVKNSGSKEPTFYDFDKCVHDITNKPMTKEQMSFRNYNHKVNTVTCNKIT